MSLQAIRVPTGVTMSSARRRQLLEHAARHDAVIIEDDYDSESNFTLNPLPALKASDRSGGWCMSAACQKRWSPGLRLGFMVADPDLIDEARALRRLVYRHPPTNIQYQMAHFLAQGHYETHLRRYHYDSAQRWSVCTSPCSAICRRVARWRGANMLTPSGCRPRRRSTPSNSPGAPPTPAC